MLAAVNALSGDMLLPFCLGYEFDQCPVLIHVAPLRQHFAHHMKESEKLNKHIPLASQLIII